MRLWGALENGSKRAIEVAHRRWGKDEVALHRTAVAAHERVAGYWHMLPEYAQARKAIWTAVNPLSGRRRIDEAFPQELRANTNDQEMFIRFKNGSTWQLIGSDNYDRLVGSSVAGVVGSEWALANPAAWAYISPILVENGGWALFITTPRGRNHAKTMLDMAKSSPDWFHEISPVSDTGAISLQAIEDQRKDYHALYGEEAGDALIEQEFYCSFSAAILGSYYGRQLEQAERAGRIGVVPYTAGVPVNTAWDLGIGDSTAIWFWQAAGSELHLIDHYESHGHGLPHYVELIEAKETAWRAEAGLDEHGKSLFVPGTDWVPGDARVRELGTGRTRLETLIALKRRPKVVPDHKLMDGINAVRQLLPRMWFDDTACASGLESLRQYRTEWSEETKTFRDTPLHDWSSHSADAMRYAAMAYRELAGQPSAAKASAKPKFLNTMTYSEYQKAVLPQRRERV